MDGIFLFLRSNCLAKSRVMMLRRNSYRGGGLVAKLKFCAVKKFDTMLKKIDEQYRNSLINLSKYKLVMFAIAKIIR